MKDDIKHDQNAFNTLNCEGTFMLAKVCHLVFRVHLVLGQRKVPSQGSKIIKIYYILNVC